MDDLINRQAAIESIQECADAAHSNHEWDMEQGYRNAIECIEEEPLAQPNLSEAYSKAVFKWLMDYQIRAAELKGRYTPYEVLSWVINDWRKEHERSD